MRVREACKAPSGAERAVEAETHGVGPEVRASRERASAGKAWGALDSCRQGEADAKRSRNTAEQQSKQLRITLARVEAELAALKAKHPPPVPVPLIIPDTIPVTVESVSEAPKYKKYNSESSARRAAKRVRKVICEYPPDCRADLLARVMITDGRGKELQISVSLVTDLLACPRMAVTMRKYAEELLAAARKHMMDTALSAGSFVAARRLLRLSYRKLQWLRRLLSHDGKEPRVMHPKYSTRVPVNPSIPEMKVEEASMLESEGDITQQEDGFGAHCADLDRAISKAIGVRAVRGELSRSGSESERHIIIWAGDGFMARKKSKWVQFGVIVGSVTGMNQSPSDVRFVMNYRGGEEYDVLNIRTDVFRAVMQRITREGCVRDEHGEIPAGVGKYVEFAIGGDKPWIMTVLGRRNMNHTYFSPSCRCTRENISCLTCDQDTHYEVDADQACRDSHVCPEMHFRGGAFVPFTCRCCGVVFKSEADVGASGWSRD